MSNNFKDYLVNLINIWMRAIEYSNVDRENNVFDELIIENNLELYKFLISKIVEYMKYGISEEMRIILRKRQTLLTTKACLIFRSK